MDNDKYSTMGTAEIKRPELSRCISRTMSLNEAVFVYKNNDTHSQKMIKAIEAYWENEEYCDLELIVGIKEKKILAHKIILVSACEYFSALLKPRMKEGKQTSVRCLEHLQSEAVEILIKYCYTGNINLKVSSEMPIEQLLEAADYMRFQEVCLEIAKFLESHLNDDNCLGFLQCADHFSLNTLYRSAFIHASYNYLGIAKAEEFLMLPLPLLEKLLKSENLIIQQSGIALPPNLAEQGIVESLIEYVKHDKEERKPLLSYLLKCMKLPLMSNDQLDTLENNEVIKDCEECRKVIQMAREIEPVKVTDAEGDDWARPRKSQGLMLREFQEYACGGQVQPEKDKFDCRDVMKVDPFVYVLGLKVGIRRWDGRKVIGGLQVFYSNGENPKYGMEIDQCESCFEFSLKPNERISKIDINAGWLIDMLRFYTNLGNEYGPYGGDGGSKYSDVPPERTCAYLAGISGAVAHSQGSLCITKLKFMWGFYDFSLKEQPMKGMLLNTSLLYIYSGRFLDDDSGLQVKNGHIVYALSDCVDPQSNNPNIDVIHCYSGNPVKLSRWTLTPYYSNQQPNQYHMDYYNEAEDSYSEEEFTSDEDDGLS